MNDQLTITHATFADEPSIKALLSQNWLAQAKTDAALDLAKRQIESYLGSDRLLDTFASGNGAIFAAKIGNVLAGAATVRITPQISFVTCMDVLSEYRRKGCGWALLSAIETENSLRPMQLFVQHADLAAIALYEKYGFRTTGTSRHLVFGHWIEGRDMEYRKDCAEQ